MLERFAARLDLLELAACGLGSPADHAGPDVAAVCCRDRHFGTIRPLFGRHIASEIDARLLLARFSGQQSGFSSGPLDANAGTRVVERFVLLLPGGNSEGDRPVRVICDRPGFDSPKDLFSWTWFAKVADFHRCL